MDTDLTIGIVSPGAMGSALGRSWRAAGARVVATVAGRSERTRSLAHGLDLVADLDAVVGQADLVCSIAPPGQALDIAATVAEVSRRLGHQPVFADLNAIAPSTVDSVRTILAEGGCAFLDGSISGGPPTPGGDTVLFLSGGLTELLTDLDAPGLSTVVVGHEPGAASAVKMCTASIYKGLSGLLAQALQTSEFYGVTDRVLTDLARGLPSYVDEAAEQIASAASKSDRYPGEMRQIAAAQASAGAEPALFEAMATVYEAIHRSDLARRTPEQARQMTDLSEVLRLLASR